VKTVHEYFGEATSEWLESKASIYKPPLEIYTRHLPMFFAAAPNKVALERIAKTAKKDLTMKDVPLTVLYDGPPQLADLKTLLTDTVLYFGVFIESEAAIKAAILSWASSLKTSCIRDVHAVAVKDVNTLAAKGDRFVSKHKPVLVLVIRSFFDVWLHEDRGAAVSALEPGGKVFTEALERLLTSCEYGAGGDRQLLESAFLDWARGLVDKVVSQVTQRGCSNQIRVALELSQRFSHNDVLMTIMYDLGIGYESDVVDDQRREHYVANGQGDIAKRQNRRHYRRICDKLSRLKELREVRVLLFVLLWSA